MSNSSSLITPIYGGDEYNRILAAIPLEVGEEESSSDFFSPVRPRRNVALVSKYLLYIKFKLFIKFV